MTFHAPNTLSTVEFYCVDIHQAKIVEQNMK